MYPIAWMDKKTGWQQPWNGLGIVLQDLFIIKKS